MTPKFPNYHRHISVMIRKHFCLHRAREPWGPRRWMGVGTDMHPPVPCVGRCRSRGGTLDADHLHGHRICHHDGALSRRAHRRRGHWPRAEFPRATRRVSHPHARVCRVELAHAGHALPMAVAARGAAGDGAHGPDAHGPGHHDRHRLSRGRGDLQRGGSASTGSLPPRLCG